MCFRVVPSLTARSFRKPTTIAKRLDVPLTSDPRKLAANVLCPSVLCFRIHHWNKWHVVGAWMVEENDA